MEKIKNLEMYNNETEKGNEILNELYDMFEEIDNSFKQYKGLKLEFGPINDLPISDIEITKIETLKTGALINFTYEDDNFICETGYIRIEDYKINDDWYSEIKEIGVGSYNFEEAIYKGTGFPELV